MDRDHWNPEWLRRVRLRGFSVVAKISRQNVGDLVFLESQKGLAIIIQNNCIKFVTQKGYNEISSGIPLFLFLLIKTHNCTLLTLHTSLTVVTMLKKLPLLQFILLTYKRYFREVDNTTHHRHSADTSIRNRQYRFWMSHPHIFST